jgi:hypothetical protein
MLCTKLSLYTPWGQYVGSKCVVPLILNLGTCCEVSCPFIPWLLYPQGRCLPLSGMLIGNPSLSNFLNNLLIPISQVGWSSLFLCLYSDEFKWSKRSKFFLLYLELEIVFSLHLEETSESIHKSRVLSSSLNSCIMANVNEALQKGRKLVL